jgi:hypothetical protein
LCSQADTAFTGCLGTDGRSKHIYYFGRGLLLLSLGLLPKMDLGRAWSVCQSLIAQVLYYRCIWEAVRNHATKETDSPIMPIVLCETQAKHAVGSGLAE